MPRRSTAMSAIAPRAADAEPPFQRFPTWMWRNTEVAAFVEWMREHNARPRAAKRRAGFYGLDIYNMSGSIAAVLAYLDEVDPDAAAVARERYGCLTPWQKRARDLRPRRADARATPSARRRWSRSAASCSASGSTMPRRRRSFLDAAQNARLVASAERYYRIMYYGGAESGTCATRHMFETLEHLLEARGPRREGGRLGAQLATSAMRATPRWARCATSSTSASSAASGSASEAALIGFGTHTGTVAAGDRLGRRHAGQAGAAVASRQLRAALPRRGRRRASCSICAAATRRCAARLLEPRLERFIGVIYRPETELRATTREASLPQQFDAYVWFDETSGGRAARSRTREAGHARHLSVRALNLAVARRRRFNKSTQPIRTAPRSGSEPFFHA